MGLDLGKRRSKSIKQCRETESNAKSPWPHPQPDGSATAQLLRRPWRLPWDNQHTLCYIPCYDGVPTPGQRSLSSWLTLLQTEQCYMCRRGLCARLRWNAACRYQCSEGSSVVPPSRLGRKKRPSERKTRTDPTWRLKGSVLRPTAAGATWGLLQRLEPAHQLL